MRNHPTSSRDLSGFLVGDDRFVKVDVGVAPCGMWDRDIWRDWQTKRFEVIQCEIRNYQNSARLRSTEHRHSLTMGEWTWMEVKLQDVRAECKRSEVLSRRWIDDLRGCSSDRPHRPPRSLANNRYKRLFSETLRPRSTHFLSAWWRRAAAVGSIEIEWVD